MLKAATKAKQTQESALILTNAVERFLKCTIDHGTSKKFLLFFENLFTNSNNCAIIRLVKCHKGGKALMKTTKSGIETVCFTGHRQITRAKALKIPSALKGLLEELIARGACRFRTGGAMGFDTIAALCVLELKEKHPGISLDLILPCRDQTKLWNDQNRAVYSHILSEASSVEYVTEHFTSWCMHERNRKLVDGSEVCIAYLEHSGGGSAYTFGYALERGLEVINLHDKIQ